MRAGQVGSVEHGQAQNLLPAAGNRYVKETPRRAAVGLALEPESSRWRLQEALRLSVRRTCTPAPTCNPRVCAYRLRDITNWRTPQGVAASIPETPGAGSASLAIVIACHGVGG